MADEQVLGQNAMEKLLSQGAGETASASPPAGTDPAAAAPQPPASPAAGAEDGPAPSDLSVPAAAGTKDGPVPSNPGQGAKPPVQEDIEKLLAQADKTPLPASTPEEATPGEGRMAEKDIDFLLQQAEQALESITAGDADIIPPGIAPFRFEELAAAPASTDTATLDLVRDVDLDLKIELGQTRMYLEDVLKLRKGSVVTLDKLAGDPVDIFVNGRLIARGEVLVLNDNFCVRVAELVAGVSPQA